MCHKSSSFPLSKFDVSNRSTFSCMYQKEKMGRHIDSNRSQTLILFFTDTPAQPEITISRLIYVRGENITLQCSAPNDAAESYWFFKDGKIIKDRPKCQENSTLLMINLDVSDMGEFSCSYSIVVSKRLVNSSQSQPFKLFVTVKPTKPSLLLSPLYPVYFKGENVTITCAAEGYKVVGYKIFKHGNMNDSLPPCEEINMYPISEFNLNKSEEYSCIFWVKIFGTCIPSAVSDVYLLKVRDPPEQPRMTLNQNSTAVLQGESLTLTCWMCNEWELNKDSTVRLISHSNHTLSSLKLTDQGNYSCRCKHNISERIIYSSFSSTVSLMVIEIPAAPSVVLFPNHTVFIRGESFDIYCSVPNNITPAFYRFFANYITISTLMQKHSQELRADNTAALSYTCNYGIHTHGKMIQSLGSKPHPICIIDHPAKPLLSAEISGWMKYRGTFIATCTAPVNQSATAFYFFKDGDLIYSAYTSDSEASQQFTLNVDLKGSSRKGDYTCTYGTVIKERSVNSSQSDAVPIPAAESLLWHLLTGSGWSLFIVLLILICCQRRSAKQKRKPPRKNHFLWASLKAGSSSDHSASKDCTKIKDPSSSIQGENAQENHVLLTNISDMSSMDQSLITQPSELSSTGQDECTTKNQLKMTTFTSESLTVQNVTGQHSIPVDLNSDAQDECPTENQLKMTTFTGESLTVQNVIAQHSIPVDLNCDAQDLYLNNTARPSSFANSEEDEDAVYANIIYEE
ncbi:platelet endothelial cell adhesion molecule-like [Protopterus annectens]|uniref:platelet endothelial cell adhesion molecule-like n=1 Tax=Protopterus annectens TaxID=7888 RepID=UPI001CFACA71|nr:platelet endothelial cell adhesion molecule-like [Protopterus annectens]